MKFIMLNGPSCSGKSTIVKRVVDEKEKFYHLSYDSQKWLFSKFDRRVHFSDVRNVVLALAEVVCKMQYNIICDSALYREYREKLFEIPKNYGYEILEINLDADYEVVAERFDKRVATALMTPNSKISNTSKERFKELYDIYEAEKNTMATSFRTDKQSVDEIYESILKMI